MKNEKIVTINGKKYRVASVDSVKIQPPKTPRKVGHSMDFARSKHINHFEPRKAPVPVAVPPKQEIRKVNGDIAPTRHPLAHKVDHIREQAKNMRAQASMVKPALVIKEEAIAEAMEKPSPIEKPAKTNVFSRHKRLFNTLSISAIIVVILSYLMYLNIPNLSVCIASAQAGIGATFPEYKPDGYSLEGPVSYSDGEVTINFHANTGKTKFVIKQSKSSWDSGAVKNMVVKNSNGSTIITTEERGLTIFSYSGNAAWVNGGILYTITGNAPLSNDQVRRIATSL